MQYQARSLSLHISSIPQLMNTKELSQEGFDFQTVAIIVFEGPLFIGVLLGLQAYIPNRSNTTFK